MNILDPMGNFMYQKNGNERFRAPNMINNINKVVCSLTPYNVLMKTNESEIVEKHNEME